MDRARLFYSPGPRNRRRQRGSEPCRRRFTAAILVVVTLVESPADRVVSALTAFACMSSVISVALGTAWAVCRTGGSLLCLVGVGRYDMVGAVAGRNRVKLGSAGRVGPVDMQCNQTCATAFLNAVTPTLGKKPSIQSAPSCRKYTSRSGIPIILLFLQYTISLPMLAVDYVQAVQEGLTAKHTMRELIKQAPRWRCTSPLLTTAWSRSVFATRPRVFENGRVASQVADITARESQITLTA